MLRQGIGISGWRREEVCEEKRERLYRCWKCGATHTKEELSRSGSVCGATNAVWGRAGVKCRHAPSSNTARPQLTDPNPYVFGMGEGSGGQLRGHLWQTVAGTGPGVAGALTVCANCCDTLPLEASDCARCWSPTDRKDLNKTERAQREFTSMLPGLDDLSYGFLPVDAILRHPQFRRYTVQDVQRVVDTNDKRRFTLHTDPATGSLKIRANQGHTLQVEELELTPISLGGGNLPAQAVHGTYLRHWPLIKAQGLRRQSRQHIHLAPGLPEDDSIISGMRSSCELAIFVELEKALNDGIPFYLSTNQVILTPGNEDGVLPPKYFQKVLQLKPTRRLLPLQ
ncbi:tRNA 2'-phosphotransferase 1-like isoform X3 [Mobula birostris]|uniref:tRNA 2'-phosphotransferase 1-like isoform X3 n=1 Tax=Mobula birostris TaxID=1983395 RepID=UPI003B27B5AC